MSVHQERPSLARYIITQPFIPPLPELEGTLLELPNWPLNNTLLDSREALTMFYISQTTGGASTSMALPTACALRHSISNRKSALARPYQECPSGYFKLETQGWATAYPAHPLLPSNVYLLERASTEAMNTGPFQKIAAERAHKNILLERFLLKCQAQDGPFKK